MASSFDIEEPSGPVAEWIAAQGVDIKKAIWRINKVAKTQYRITSPVGANSAPFSGVESAENIMVAIPVQFPSAIQNYSIPTFTVSNPPTQAQVQAIATAFTDLATSYNALLSQLRIVAINPSAG